jgi:putative ATP-binding cassette transporter
MRVRENGESIALLGGEEEERSGIDRSFGKVLKQWALLCGQHMRTTIVSQGSSLIAPVIPILLCAPKFLEGSMTLGQVMQAASAFTIVQSAFGWLVDNYPRLAEWNAGARRIASLMMSLDGLERAETGEGLNHIKRGETEGNTMPRLNDLSVTLDDGTAVVGEAEILIEPGEWVLVSGESGTARAHWCARLQGFGHGAAAASISMRIAVCSCCRKNPMCRRARCVALPLIPRPLKIGASSRSGKRSTRWGWVI